VQNGQNRYIKTTGNERLKTIVIFSVLAYGRKLTPFVILKKKKYFERK
jgi:hypothetical protein